MKELKIKHFVVSWSVDINDKPYGMTFDCHNDKKYSDIVKSFELAKKNFRDTFRAIKKNVKSIHS